MPTFWLSSFVWPTYTEVAKSFLVKKKKKKNQFLAVDILEDINSGTGFLNLNAFYNVRILKFESGTTLTYRHLSPLKKNCSSIICVAFVC